MRPLLVPPWRKLDWQGAPRNPPGLNVGRWQLLWRWPLSFTFQREDSDGWSWIGWAWVWGWPRRWQFPHERPPAEGFAPLPKILDAWTFGPIDLRRFADPPESWAERRSGDKAGLS